MSQRIKHVLSAAALVSCLGLAVATASVQEDQGQAGAAGLEQLKHLAGEWVTLGDDGQPTDNVLVTYRVSAGGHVVLETLFPGSDQEMLSLYFEEDDGLAMTHFCSLGNRPHLHATVEKENELAFECNGTNGIDCASEEHIHHASLTWDGPDRLTAAWRPRVAGEAGEGVKLALARK